MAAVLLLMCWLTVVVVVMVVVVVLLLLQALYLLLQVLLLLLQAQSLAWFRRAVLKPALVHTVDKGHQSLQTTTCRSLRQCTWRTWCAGGTR